MIITLGNILSTTEAAAICEPLSDNDLFSNGSATAAGKAKFVKNNLQANSDHPFVRAAISKAKSALSENALFRSATQIASYSRVMISRYDKGMSYGDHVDAAFIDGIRTDLSFTLFLNEPEHYVGGELIVEEGSQEDTIKLPAGACVVYPSTSIHRVSEVTCGSRYAVVGWVKSRVRFAEDRKILFDLDRTLAALAPDAPGRTDLANVRNNLLRRFGD
ncbi:MAG: Fe2+-dependent dioxygenase [Pseudomonadota bacterium]